MYYGGMGPGGGGGQMPRGTNVQYGEGAMFVPLPGSGTRQPTRGVWPTPDPRQPTQGAWPTPEPRQPTRGVWPTPEPWQPTQRGFQGHESGLGAGVGDRRQLEPVTENGILKNAESRQSLKVSQAGSHTPLEGTHASLEPQTGSHALHGDHAKGHWNANPQGKNDYPERSPRQWKVDFGYR